MMGNDAWSDIRRLFEGRAQNRSSDADAAAIFKGADAAASDALYSAIAADIGELLEPKPRDSLLEIGCGPGALLERLAPKVGHACGIDVSPAMVEVTRSKGISATSYDGDRLPYADASFDIVVLYSVILNICRRDLVMALLDEALRVLKPSGALMVGDNFHPALSKLPSHYDAKEQTRRERILTRLGLSHGNPVDTYATDYGVFSDLMLRHPIAELRFTWQRNDYPYVERRMAGRYHVLLRKAALNDARSLTMPV